MFVSAPVIKRYDMFSLKNVDGIYLLISGFINKQCSVENGFDPQVFSISWLDKLLCKNLWIREQEDQMN